MMDNDRIVEIGARVLFEDTQVGRWKLYGYAQKQWGDEPESEKRCIRQMRAVLAAFEKAGLVVAPAEPTPEMRQLGGEFNCPTETLTSACDYAVDVYKAMVRVAQGKEPRYDAAETARGEPK